MQKTWDVLLLGEICSIWLVRIFYRYLDAKVNAPGKNPAAFLHVAAMFWTFEMLLSE
jgi:hypothetical protein